MMDPQNNKVKILLLSLLLLTLPCRQTRAEKAIGADNLADKMRGMWLGQMIGNYAGRETEGKYSGSEPNPDASVPWVIKQQWDADDDTDMEYVALHILETNGLDCNWHQIADQWRTHITSSGIYIANKQARYLMADGRLPPDTGSRTYNEHWYSIDSQITTEMLGAVSPGLVQSAIDLAGRFARVTNTGFAVHAAQFYSAMYATAFFEPNAVDIVIEGLKAIPATSRTHQVITDVLNWYSEDAGDGSLDWRATRKKLYDNYQGPDSYGRYYNWVESSINAGATTLAILYGRGDFKDTVQIAVLAGWDCDCNAATAGGLIGISKGFGSLPSDLTDPNICGDVYKNVHRPYLPDPNQYLPQYDTITNNAVRLGDLAEQNILGNGGYITGAGPAKTYHIPDGGGITPEP
jgi:ADP-ribosylglycohydrolase